MSIKFLFLANDTNLNGYANGELYWDDGESIIPDDDLSKHNYYHFLYNFTLNKQSASLNITCPKTAVRFFITTKRVSPHHTETRRLNNFALFFTIFRQT